MATNNIIPNMAAGNNGAVDLGLNNLGVKPFGNAGGTQTPGPSGVGGAIPVTGNPVMSPMGGSINPAAANPVLSPAITGSTSAIPTTGLTADSGTISNPISTTGLGASLGNTFGQGVGTTVASTIQNLGSSNSQYMQAYEEAMAQPNAENLASLQTSLGNEGVGANSSTAAIAQADFQQGITTQEGLQEQQLQQNDLSQMTSLEEAILPGSEAATQNSGWSIFGQAAGEIGGMAAGAMIPKI